MEVAGALNYFSRSIVSGGGWFAQRALCLAERQRSTMACQIWVRLEIPNSSP